MLLLLPTDVLFEVCAFLSVRTRLLHLALVCKHLSAIARRSITSLRRWKRALDADALSQLPNLRAVTVVMSPAKVLASLPSLNITELVWNALLVAPLALTGLTRLACRLPECPLDLIALNAPRLVSLSFVSSMRGAAARLPPLPALRSLTLQEGLGGANALSHFTPYCSALTSLKWTPPYPANDMSALFATHAPHLHTLNLSLGVRNTTAELVEWVNALPSLTSLTLRLKAFGELHWRLLAHTTSCLVALSLRELPPQTQRLGELLDRCTKLRMLRLSARSGLTAPHHAAFERVGSRLQSVGNTLVWNFALSAQIAALCTGLTRLVLLATDPCLAAPHRLRLPRLRKLHLWPPKFGTVGLYDSLCTVRGALQAFPTLTAVKVLCPALPNTRKDGEVVSLLEELAYLARATLLHPPLRLQLNYRPRPHRERLERLQRECSVVHIAFSQNAAQGF